MRNLETIINKAKRRKRVKGGLVLCDLCDTPASASISKALSWTACAPCAFGEADSFDPKDLIPVEDAPKWTS